MVAAAAVAALVAGLVGVLVGMAVDDGEAAVGTAGPRRSRRSRCPPASSRAPRLPIQAVATAVGPSVVTISADVVGGRAVGTGVIVSSDGEILTNAHVVDGATAIRVRLAGETEPTEARLVASDAGNDLALLSIDASGLLPVAFAPTAEVGLGDEVVAIGFALDLDGEPERDAGDRLGARPHDHHRGRRRARRADPDRCGDLLGQLGRPARRRPGPHRRDQHRRGPRRRRHRGDERRVRHLRRRGRVGARRPAHGEGRRGQGRGVPRDHARRAHRRGSGRLVTEVQDDSPAATAGIEAGDVVIAIDESATDGQAGVIAAVSGTTSRATRSRCRRARRRGGDVRRHARRTPAD